MRIVALASGGIDSSVMMMMLKKEGHDLFPLFIDYGQLAKKKEWEACQKICRYLGLKPCRMDISGFGKIIPSGITNGNLDIEKDAFLPTRNLLFLTLGAAYGYVKSAYVTAIGLLSNPIFPDQTADFVQMAQKSISTALGADIKILAPLMSLNKTDALGLARKYELPLSHTYSCHSGNEEPCGCCISCKERVVAEDYFSKKSLKPSKAHELTIYNRVVLIKKMFGGIDLGGGGSYPVPTRTPEEAERVFKTAVDEVQRARTQQTRELKTYRIFVSHAWTYSQDYYRLTKMLDEAPDFSWQNYSVPEHDPLHDRTKKDLEQALRNQIRPTHIVIILAGMYVPYREWIQKEIDIALEMNKPIIGIKPWGSERIPQDVQDVAREIVGWNTSSIVSAIERWAL